MSAAGPDYSQFISRVHRTYSKYSSSSGSKDYDNSFDASSEVEDIITSINAQIKPDVSFAAKQDAVSTIMEIAGEVLEGDSSTLGSEMRKNFCWQPVGAAVSHILSTLSEEELAALQADGEMLDDLVRLREQAEDYALDLDLDNAVDELAVEESEAEDDISEDEAPTEST